MNRHGKNLARAVVRRLLPRDLRRRIRRWRDDRLIRPIPIANILQGGEMGLNAEHYARIIGDPLRPSRRLAEGPHVRLLERYKQLGEKLLDPECLRETDYYRHADRIIDVFGNYFEARCEDDIPAQIRYFLSMYEGGLSPCFFSGSGHTTAGGPIAVSPVACSDCFQMLDGSHRAAIAHVRGKEHVTAFVTNWQVVTPLQSMLSDVLWQGGERELYQPVRSPELEKGWVLVRKCIDRLEKMRGCLGKLGLLPPNAETYLDIGSSYGWFVAEMAKLGFVAHGVERDPASIAIGRVVYGNSPESVTRSDCVRFLRGCRNRYSVVSCFSILHHFVMNNGGDVSAEELVRLIDRVTESVLFVDMGQSHEAWFSSRLRGWDTDYIEHWLRTNTTFRQIVRLGPDEDAVPPFEDNYSRMLFACLR